MKFIVNIKLISEGTENFGKSRHTKDVMNVNVSENYF